jgi:hypothetical protein
MHVGLSSQAKRLPTLAKSPLQAVLQVAHSERGFTLCWRNWIITALAYNRGFKTTPWIQEQVPSGAFKKQKGEDQTNLPIWHSCAYVKFS